MAKTKEEFLSTMPESNVEWAAQRILTDFNRRQIIDLKTSFERLGNSLDKSWANDMTLREIEEAITMANDFKPDKKRKEADNV